MARWGGVATALLVGILAGVVLGFGLEKGMTIGLSLAAALLLAPIAVMRPTWVFYAFVLAILILEEFPSGVAETDVTRSVRTAFYSKSLGLPGVYSTDVGLGVCLALFLGSALLSKRVRLFPLETIGVGLLFVALPVLLSTAVSLATGPPLSEWTLWEAGSGRLGVKLGTALPFDVNERALRYIAFFQFKIYAYLFVAYVLGLLVFDRWERIRHFVWLFVLAGLADIGIGTYRLVTTPHLISEQIPLFYHNPTTWMFASILFYVVACWGYGLYSARQLVLPAILVAWLTVYALLSFRRSIYGSILLGAAILFLMLPPKGRWRMLLFAVVSIALVVPLILVSPVGGSAIDAIRGRLAQTGLTDTSTLYRLSIFYYVKQHHRDIPFLGWGALPLWNKITQLGGVWRTNLEGVHSLYFWWLFRTGVVGCVLAATGGIIVLWDTGWACRRLIEPRERVLAIVIFIAVVMVAFSGLFNPVYADARYLIVSGFGLAIVTRLKMWQRERVKKAVVPW